MAKDFAYYFAQLRRIEEHREASAEKEIRKLYRRTIKDLRHFLADEYAALAQDGKLSFDILRARTMDARFLEEVERQLGGLSPAVTREIHALVDETQRLAFEGFKLCAEKGAGLTSPTAEKVQHTVDNALMDMALEKNHKENIWNIKRELVTMLTSGDRYETMARRMASVLDGGYKKAILIARTESTRVRESAHLDAAKELNDAIEQGESGLRFVKQWKTMRDGAVRDQHSPMNNKVVLMDEDFVMPDGTRMPAPGQCMVARQVCNCRCFVTYKLMTADEIGAATGKAPGPTKKQQTIAKYERQEQDVLAEQAKVQAEQSAHKNDMTALEAEQYKNIWKNPVTVKDYENLKDRVQAKRDYFDAQFATDGDAKWTALNKRLDEFVANGEKYLKIRHKYDAASAQLTAIADDLADVRAKLMRANGIDPDKLKDDIADMTEQIKVLESSVDWKAIKLEDTGYTAEDYLGDASVKKDIDGNLKFYADEIKGFKANGLEVPEYVTKEHAVYKKFVDSVKKAQKGTTKQIAELEKQIKAKQDELADILRRYGLEDDKFTQARKDAAYWFKDMSKADDVLRPHTGDVWRAASDGQRDAAYTYTSGSGGFNRPLRGYEGNWYSYKGVGKVDLDYEGRGQMIADLTDFIDGVSYDFDIWVNRGVESVKGAASFLDIPEDVFNNATQDELEALLIGKTVSDPAFLSTGAVKGAGFSGPLTVNLYCPAGTKMLYCEPFSRYGHGAGAKWDGIKPQSSYGYEFEVLLQRGTQYKITKVEKTGGRVYVDVDVVGVESR